MEQCPKCGSQEIDYGVIKLEDGIMEIKYHSHKKKFLKTGTNVAANVCLSCGYTELYSHLKHLKQTVKDQS